ncbi:MAG TPA: hypothetical protein QGF58_22490 [Myxococcota bacterium]|nr:hypothetical protein [Myxococcota bacterium]
MDASTWVIVGVAALLGINRLIWVGKRHRRIRFFGIQLLNILGACYMILWGVPQFTGQLQVANWVLAAVIVFHAVQNNRRVQREAQEASDDDTDEDDARRAAVMARLKGEADEDDE